MEQRPAIDDQLFRKSLGRFATGVSVITVAHQDHVHGMTAGQMTNQHPAESLGWMGL
jgi:flavin reductase (DIM6/NTAB) family NADH-FMN oxidoreductase RutF